MKYMDILQKATVFDIETNIPDTKAFKDIGQLSITSIEWVGVCPCIKQGEVYAYRHLSEIPPFDENAPIVGHNIIRFDLPVIDGLPAILSSSFTPPSFLPEKKKRIVFDTLIMSKLLFPTRQSHSLESWAETLEMEKSDLSDLRLRVKTDVEITCALLAHLCKEADKVNLPVHVLELEQLVAAIVSEQHFNGVKFDLDKGRSLYTTMLDENFTLKESISKTIPLVPIPKSQLRYPPKKQFRTDGTPSAHIEKYITSYKGILVEESAGVERVWRADVPDPTGTFGLLSYMLPISDPIERFKAIDIDSTNEMKNYLLSKGWKPTMWNYKKDSKGKLIRPLERTSPKIYDEQKEICSDLKRMAREALVDGNLADNLAKYYSTQNRINVLRGWLENYRVTMDQRLCSDADTVGAATYRFTHRIIANVPRVTTPYGKEMRSLFIPAAANRRLVGWDASALEARLEAHFTIPYDKGAYAEELLEGDIHTKNQLSLSLKSRDEAKTWKYAVGYGAQAEKLAATFGWTVAEAQERLEQYWASNPALTKLRDDVRQAAQKRGYVLSIDRRRVYVPQPHAALNRLIQSSGAIAMKYSMCIADRLIKREKLDAYGIIRYHDEEQWDSHAYCADRVGQLGVESVGLAGRHLKLRVPLLAEYKVGKSWAETH